jgi:hypothetical protein
MKSSLGYVLGERMNMIFNVTIDTSVFLCSKVFQLFLNLPFGSLHRRTITSTAQFQEIKTPKPKSMTGSADSKLSLFKNDN